jgi:hypothetical protein
MRAVVILFAAVLAGFVLIGGGCSRYKSYGHSDEGLVMYSLTTCGNCMLKARQLKARGVRFDEYFIDQNKARDVEMWDKLRRAGYSRQSIGTPVFDAGGFMLPDNPSLDSIDKAMTMSLAK